MALGDLLAGTHEDPASAAARNIDWPEFLDDQDDRYTAMVRCAVSGQPMNSLKRKFRVSDSTSSTFKRNLASDISETMGTHVLEAVRRRPRWQADVEAEQEGSDRAPIFFDCLRATGEVLARSRRRAARLKEARTAAVSGVMGGSDPAPPRCSAVVGS